MGNSLAGARQRRHLYNSLKLLCNSGAGLQAIASAFCGLACQLLEADAGMVCWLTEDGVPLGFYHNTAPVELKDLFVSNMDQMFLLGEEISVATLVAPTGPLIGKMLDPDLQERFRQGNIYRHLCMPLGHHHLLDMRAHVPGVGLAGFGAWNSADRPFSGAHVALLEPVQPLMHLALATDDTKARWRSVSIGTPHLIANEDGTELVVLDSEAEQTLRSSHMLRDNISLTQMPGIVPAFVKRLAEALRSSPVAEMQIPVVDGRLVCRASRTRFLQPDDGERWHVFVALDLQVAEEVAMVLHLLSLKLSPLQREIALFALQGGDRAQCLPQFNVRPESLKKHLRAIYEQTGAGRWTDLQEIRVPLGVHGMLEAR